MSELKKIETIETIDSKQAAINKIVNDPHILGEILKAHKINQQGKLPPLPQPIHIPPLPQPIHVPPRIWGESLEKDYQTTKYIGYGLIVLLALGFIAAIIFIPIIYFNF
jgi:hypothetical protein